MFYSAFSRTLFPVLTVLSQKINKGDKSHIVYKNDKRKQGNLNFASKSDIYMQESRIKDILAILTLGSKA